ncbi:MAG: aminoacyl-tRNA deacylase [Gammaproteobacteria bacterium]|nr:MAG: aminoacyl-tRNA deacylase [Gammaproteobacteria bacterium]
MAIALTLQKYLADNGVAYDLVPHRHTSSSINSAQSAHITGNNLAKSVILEDETGYLMAVVPATEHVQFRKVNHALNRHFGMAIESELESLFYDCELGAIPAVGKAYLMESIVDDKLESCSDIYFEAGDHEELVHLKGSSFRKLMKDSHHAEIC